MYAIRSYYGIKQPFAIRPSLKKAKTEGHVSLTPKNMTVNGAATVQFKNINLGTGYYRNNFV